MLKPTEFNDDKLLICFTGTAEGNVGFNYGNLHEAKQNYLNVLLDISIEKENTYDIEVEHSDRIIRLTKENIANKSFQCDALFTTLKGKALLLKPADCAPLILTNKERSFIGLIHLGWKSTDLSLAKKAIEYASSEFKTKFSEIKCLIGPAIRKDLYTYKGFIPPHPEVWTSFVELDNNMNEKIDNIGAIRKQLLESGVTLDNIHDVEIDTFADQSYFSHARDFHNGLPDSGRNGVFVMLK
jgi:polyphenol oxidase